MPQYIIKRLADDWRLLASIFFGITVAASLIAGAPVYVRTLDRQGLDTAIDRSSLIQLNILTSAIDVPLAREELRRVEQSVVDAIQRDISDIYRGHQRSLKTDTYLRDPTEIAPQPKMAVVQSVREQASGRPPSLGYFINLHNIQDHITLLRGHMARDTISSESGYRRLVEAVVGARLAERLDLGLGDVVTLTPLLDEPARILARSTTSARIVGIAEPTDSSEEYWQGRASLFFDPPVMEDLPDFGIEVDPQRTPLALIITPDVAARLPDPLVEPAGFRFTPGHFATLSNVEGHVTFLQGRMASDTISSAPYGPLVEAVVGAMQAQDIGLSVGDVIALTPFVDEPTWISARIVGIAEPTDLSEEYWRWGPIGFFFPEPPPLYEPPDLGLLITREAMVEAVGKSYPGSLASAAWYIFVDKEGLKEWSASETRLRLGDMDTGIGKALPGQVTTTGIKRLLADFERRAFLASVPLLLLLVTMLATLLYFLSMMVSYLVQSRESDVALLRSRGVTTLQLLRLYALEGVALTAVATVLAPFIAIGAVAAAGKLPYFREITGGSFLPVEWDWVPFAAAAGAGLLSLSIFVVPGVVGARMGLVIHKLRSSRPPSVPFFQRYYLDLGLLVLGGLVFWELHARGQLVVGGLFDDVQVNKTLLVTPVLFLIVVALLFMRFSPLVLRFFSGESPALLHLVVAAAVAVLGPAIVVRDVRAGDVSAWLAPVALVLAFAAVYWATAHARGARVRLGGLAVQAGLVTAVVVAEPPASGEMLSIPILALIAIVPAQVAFLLFQASARVAPVWVSLAIWRVARNPLQYSWLVLLLVLATGLATFSTTLGATLDERDTEGIRYNVAADIRVTFLRDHPESWLLMEEYLAVPEVTSVSPAYRRMATGPPTLGGPFEVLAVESQGFSSISWYRDDFSARPLSDIMRALRDDAPAETVAIPEGTSGLGLWARLPSRSYFVFIDLVVQDGLGTMSILPLGRLGSHEWLLMRADLPAGMEPPIALVSVRIRPATLLHLPNTILLDDIHATVGPDGEEHLLDGFEGGVSWMPLPASILTSESVLSTTDDAFRGNRAGAYSFGQGADRGVPGIYRSPTGGPLPLVASSSFMADSGIGAGETFIVALNGRLLPVVVRDTVEYFPTLDPGNGGFVLADLSLLLRHQGIIDPGAEVTPNEFFLDMAPTDGPAAAEKIRRMTPWRGQVDDRDSLRESLLESSRLNPLVTGGRKAMALLSLAIAVITAATGYVAYLLFFAERSRGEMRLVRSLGLAHRQMIGLLALEHLFIVAIGMGLGTWAGFQISALAVDAVSQTETGGLAIPPLLVTTDWIVLTAILSALFTTFVAMLLVLKRSIFRLDLRSISRAEG